MNEEEKLLASTYNKKKLEEEQHRERLEKMRGRRT